jgi:hypothetical protein
VFPQKLFTTLTLFALLACFVGAPAQTEKKEAFAIVIDNTGSLRTQFEIVIDVSKGIVQQTHERGPVSLFPFRSTGSNSDGLAVISSDADWSQDREALDSDLDDLYIVPGQTALRDGVGDVARQLNSKVDEAKDAYSAKTLFLISDGEDRSSRISERDLIALLKESGIKVFAVGLVKDLDSEGGLLTKASQGKAVSFLEKIAKETGGRAVIAKSKRDDPQVLLKALFAK